MVAYKARWTGSPGSLVVVLVSRSLAEQWLPSALAQAPRVSRRSFAHPLNFVREAPSLDPWSPLMMFEFGGDKYDTVYSVSVSGKLNVCGGRIRPAGQAEASIFLEVLRRPWEPSSARTRGGVPYVSSLRVRNFFSNVRWLRASASVG